jgi:uncharacterized C2H2 Zn-finger protein
MVHHADGRTDYQCPKCDSVMKSVDNYSMHFYGGEVVESGKEYLTCPNCGLNQDFPKMRVSDFKHLEVGL